MKKFISLLLCLVMILSFAVPSFAYPHSDTEMEALNEIEYWTYWIHQDFTGFFTDTNDWLSSIWQVITNSIAANVHLMESDVDSLAQNMLTLVSRSESSLSNLLDINEYLRSVNTEISSLNDNLFGNFTFLEPFAQVVQTNLSAMAADLEHTNQLEQYLLSDRWDFIEGSWWLSMYDDLHQLKEVLASDEDLALRDSMTADVFMFKTLFFDRSTGLNTSLDSTAIFQLGGSFASIFDIFGSGTGTTVSDNISGGMDTFGMLFEFPVSWFSETVSNDLNSASLFYSRNDSYVPELATSYYPSKEDRLSFLRGEIND